MSVELCPGTWRTRGGDRIVIEYKCSTDGLWRGHFPDHWHPKFGTQWSSDGSTGENMTEYDIVSKWETDVSELVIEAGKYYRTRGGDKAFVGYRSQVALRSWCGEVFHRGEKWIPISWSDAGHLSSHGDELAGDLVAPWTEPEPQPMTDEELREFVLDGRCVMEGSGRLSRVFRYMPACSVYPARVLVAGSGAAFTAEDLIAHFTDPDGNPLTSKVAT